MNLDTARKLVHSELGKVHGFLYKGMRNQNEIFDGRIIKCYPSIFIIEANNGQIKSFTYNDFIIKVIRIIT